MSLVENTSVIKGDLYTKYLENEIEYFESIRQPEILIEEIADNVNIGSNTLTGLSFPLCVVIEGLCALSSIYSSRKISLLKELLTTYLYENYKNYGFNYFNEGYIPLDLDTVSSMTRILGEKYPDVLNTYNDIIDRNLENNGLVPTWLDSDEHKHWCSGNSIFHIDVMLNYWLTEVKFKNSLDVELMKNAVILKGLKNYWYIPSLYTPYLYFKLLNKSKLLNDVACLEPLVKALKDYSNDSNSYHARSNTSKIIIVQSLIKQNKCKMIDDVLFTAMSDSLSSRNNYGGIGISSPKSTEVTLAGPPKNEVLYWSLRFQLYKSSITVRSFLLDCIITSMKDKII